MAIIRGNSGPTPVARGKRGGFSPAASTPACRAPDTGGSAIVAYSRPTLRFCFYCL